MELPGETYLFNFSIIAITVTAVSALVMLLRQVMGGKLSNFDIHLITSYVSLGFVLALDAILPPLVALGDPAPAVLWAIASGLAAAFLAFVIVTLMRRRRRIVGSGSPFLVRVDWTLQWAAILLLVVNAAVPPVQGMLLFASALTLSMATMMWSFVRRIASLLGDKPGEDWDPHRG